MPLLTETQTHARAMYEASQVALTATEKAYHTAKEAERSATYPDTERERVVKALMDAWTQSLIAHSTTFRYAHNLGAL